MQDKLSTKRKEFNQKQHDYIKRNYGHPAKASIVISFREEVGRTLNAAFYDHYTIRKITSYPTVGAISPSSSKEQGADRVKNFKQFIEADNNTLSLAIDGNPEKIIPLVETTISLETGALFLPGARRFPKPGEHHEERCRYEEAIIKQALLNGRPMLAICGGSRKLWALLGGITTEVSGHTSPSMPTIESNGNIANNQALHRIELQSGTQLKSCMEHPFGEYFPKVNSIHWGAAISTKEVLERAKISALSKHLEIDHPNHELTIDTIEAFENKSGVPFFGIQWHPEAYYKTSFETTQEAIEYKRQQNIITYIAKAGDAFRAKQSLLKDFKQKISPSETCLKLGLFKPKKEKQVETQESSLRLQNKC